MPGRWRVINSPEGDGPFNMALDEAISVMVRRGDSPPTLRLYGWQRPWISIGAFQEISDVALDCCRGLGIETVRRPTGGRGILHGDELTYSFSAKTEGPFKGGLRESYRLLSAALARALAGVGLEVDAERQWRRPAEAGRTSLCFQAISFGEIAVRGRKIAGSAQKRWPEGFLQQGSIPYGVDYRTLRKVFTAGSGKGRPAAGSGAGDPRERMAGLRELVTGFEGPRFRESLTGAFEACFRVPLEAAPPSPQEIETALRLAEAKYRNPRWTLERGQRSQS